MTSWSMSAPGTVIFSDISQELLDHCRARAGQLGRLGRCRFLRASVDVVTTRSVLIYVAAKGRAVEEVAARAVETRMAPLLKAQTDTFSRTATPPSP